jgi:hypothetical protein
MHAAATRAAGHHLRKHARRQPLRVGRHRCA